MTASTTLATADSILKEIYEPRIRNQIQSDTKALTRIEKTAEGVADDVGGKYVKFPIRTRRNHGIGARLENEPLPEPKSQKYASATVKLAYLYGSMSITGQAMRLAETNTQAFASVLTEESKGLREGLAKDQNRQLFGTSDGAMAVVTADGANTVTVDNTQYLELGMVVDIWDPTFATERVDKREITAINLSTKVVTYSGADGAASANDVIVRHNSQQRETVGFRQIVSDTGILFGIDPSVEPVWKSTVAANGGVNRAISEALMIRVVDDIRVSGGGTPSVIFCGLGVRRAYWQLLSQTRETVNTTKFEGGFSGLAFNAGSGDIPLIEEVDCQPNRMYFLNEKELKHYRDAEWQFMDEDGSRWQRIITAAGRYDAYEAMMFKYCNLGTHRRNAHGLLADITEA